MGAAVERVWTRRGESGVLHAMRSGKVRRLALASVLWMACAGVASGGDSPAASAARGRAVLDRAVAELGGLAALEAPESWFVAGEGRENLSAELQGTVAARPTWRPHEERVAVDARTLSVAWERRTPRNDMSLRWRRFVRGRDSSGFYDFHGGFGRLRAAATPERDRRSLARRVPHLLLLEAATRATDVAWRGERRFADGLHDEIAVTLPEGAVLSLLVARAPALLRRVSYTLELPGLGPVPVDWEWARWREDSRLGRIPLGHRVRVDGETFQEVRYSAYGADRDRARDLLSIPPNRPAAAPASAMTAPSREPAPPASGEVAPGVHVIEAENFMVMFVEFRDFVVAMEAPENHPGLEGIPAARDTTPVTAGFLAAIRAAAPGKPVRYAVLSHHHSDHMGGARAFAEAGATLLVAPADRAAARRAIGGRGETAAPAAAIEPVAERRVITDGERTLEILNVGRNPHTDENLFAWLPRERIAFQGDLFYYQQGGEFPPPGRETMNRFFARWLARRGIAPLAIYGVHNDGAAGERELAAMR